MWYFRDSISDPYTSELKGSPGFESVSTAYKTVLSQDDESRQHQPHSSGESDFSALFKRSQYLIGLYEDSIIQELYVSSLYFNSLRRSQGLSSGGTSWNGASALFMLSMYVCLDKHKNVSDISF
jgi:hypothetical protein